MKKTILSTIALAAVLLIGGCANKDMEAKHSGFLKNYDDMKENDKFEGSMVRVMPGANLAKYDSIIITPVQILSAVEEDAKTPEQKELFVKMSKYLTDGYKKAVTDAPNYKLVDVAGPTTMKFEVAISAVEVHFDDMQWYQFIPISLAITGVARATYVDGAVRILAEARLSDSETDKVLLRSMDLQKGEEVKTDEDHLTFEDVKPALDAWGKRAKKQLPELKKLIDKVSK